MSQTCDFAKLPANADTQQVGMPASNGETGHPSNGSQLPTPFAQVSLFEKAFAPFPHAGISGGGRLETASPAAII
jgi:hypothetical protein